MTARSFATPAGAVYNYGIGLSALAGQVRSYDTASWVVKPQPAWVPNHWTGAAGDPTPFINPTTAIVTGVQKPTDGQWWPRGSIERAAS